MASRTRTTGPAAASYSPTAAAIGCTSSLSPCQDPVSHDGLSEDDSHKMLPRMMLRTALLHRHNLSPGTMLPHHQKMSPTVVVEGSHRRLDGS